MRETLDVNYFNRGTIELGKGKSEKALTFFKKQQGEFKELYLNMANAYRNLDNYRKAWEYYEKANRVDVTDIDGRGGEYPNALSNMGLLAYQENDDTLCCTLSNRALAIDPLHYMTIWNYSLALLRGYCSGEELHKWAWKMHEYRFKAVKAVDTSVPRWDGSKVSVLLVIAEQGFGDKLMYARYLSEAAKFCDRLIVQCPTDMAGLFDYETTELIASATDATATIPFGCLAEVFGRKPGDWLAAKYPKTVGSKYKVAVEWAGSKTHLNDRNRSCYSSYFTKLAKAYPEIDFVNIRPDAPVVKGVRKVAGANWEDSAKEIASCNLVVSVDTSVVHLAGSLGVDTLMMQPLVDTDFRWGNPRTKEKTGMDVEKNIWYDTVAVLENRGWDSMFAEINKRVGIKYQEWLNDQN